MALHLWGVPSSMRSFHVSTSNGTTLVPPSKDGVCHCDVDICLLDLLKPILGGEGLHAPRYTLSGTGMFTWNPNDPSFDWKRPCFFGGV